MQTSLLMKSDLMHHYVYVSTGLRQIVISKTWAQLSLTSSDSHQSASETRHNTLAHSLTSCKLVALRSRSSVRPAGAALPQPVGGALLPPAALQPAERLSQRASRLPLPPMSSRLAGQDLSDVPWDQVPCGPPPGHGGGPRSSAVQPDRCVLWQGTAREPEQELNSHPLLSTNPSVSRWPQL